MFYRDTVVRYVNFILTDAVGKMVGAEQLRQLHALHNNFADEIRNTPGRTNLAVHTIVANGPPTRLPPIDCHIAIGIQWSWERC